MKFYICEDLGCVYRWSARWNELEWTPLFQDGTFDFDAEGGTVDEDMVGEEDVTFHGKPMTLSEVFRIVEGALGVKAQA